MRVFAIVALMALVNPVLAESPAHFEVRNTSDLVRLCSTPAGDEHYTTAIAFCHGFGTGAYRYYEAATDTSDRFVCPPAKAPTRAQIFNDFLTWSKTHSEHMEKPAVNTLFRYLGERFPCNK